MKNPLRHPRSHSLSRRIVVRAEIEHRRLLRLSRSLCTRHYFLLH